MAFTSKDLTNNGRTAHYQIQYDDSLDPAVGKAVGNALVAGCESDFGVMTGWFNGQSSPFTSTRMTVNIQAGNTASGGTGASWNTRSGPITLIPGLPAATPGASVSQWFVRYLLVSEVVEMFMEAQGLGWSGSTWDSQGTEGSAGEGLSRFLGAQFMLQNSQLIPGGYDIAWTWLTSSDRADFVNHVDAKKNGFVPECGCAVLFIYYLFHQLGFTIPQIVAAGAKELGTVYTNLTGDPTDPFPYFKQLLDVAFPGTSTITSGNLDDPFPLGSLTFYGAKNTFGRDEVTDLVDHAAGIRERDFFLALDGFSTSTLGLTRPSDPVIAFTGVTTTRNGVDAQFQSSNPRVPQRILFPYDIHVTAATEGAFPASGQTPAAVSSSITVLGRTFTANDEFFFAAGEDPYFVNVRFDADPAKENAPWLSQDLRVFTAVPGLNQFPVKGGPQFGTDSVAGAYAYAQALIGFLNASYNDPAGVDPFDAGSDVLPGQADAYTGDSSVTPRTWVAPFASFTNYNFAVCRVRLNGANAAHADGVKVFFRLWRTQTADTGFDPNGTYLSQTDSGSNPLWPLAPSDSHSIPFFATGNAPNFNDPGNPEYGTNGANNQKITISHAAGQWTYFACFLNVYDPNFTVNGASVQSKLVGDHHCLVAQIAYSGAPIQNAGGVVASPENSDKLAQRNLQVSVSGNPGIGATRQIPQTFELRPGPAASADAAALPDELMIEWGTVPPGSAAQIYWPGGSAADVVAQSTRLYGVHDLTVVDPHTVGLPTTSGVSYVPMPTGSGDTLAGLLTIDLPPTVVKGQTYDVVIRRLSSRTVGPPPIILTIADAPETPERPAEGSVPRDRHPAAAEPSRGRHTESHPDIDRQGPPETRRDGEIRERYVVGSFQVRIPVQSELVMLPAELDRLAIFKARLAATPGEDPWHPVLVRYVSLLGDRVAALGGDPAAVPPSYDGYLQGHGCGRRHCDDGCAGHERCREHDGPDRDGHHGEKCLESKCRHLRMKIFRQLRACGVRRVIRRACRCLRWLRADR
jgi:hypothetical protein